MREPPTKIQMIKSLKIQRRNLLHLHPSCRLIPEGGAVTDLPSSENIYPSGDGVAIDFKYQNYCYNH